MNTMNGKKMFKSKLNENSPNNIKKITTILKIKLIEVIVEECQVKEKRVEGNMYQKVLHQLTLQRIKIEIGIGIDLEIKKNKNIIHLIMTDMIIEIKIDIERSQVKKEIGIKTEIGDITNTKDQSQDKNQGQETEKDKNKSISKGKDKEINQSQNKEETNMIKGIEIISIKSQKLGIGRD